MKKILSVILLAFALSSCGSAIHSTSSSADKVNDGYGDISRDKVTSAVSKADIDDKNIKTYSDMYAYLQGRIPGVTVSGKSIIIRGIGTNSSNTQPLILVDGVEVSNLDSVDPQYVEDVTVIKDGSAAMYGVRDANGGILITLKRN